MILNLSLTNLNRFKSLCSDPENKFFMPFFTLGDLNFERSLLIIKKLVEAGVKLIELSFPLSDPIADGPKNKRSMAEALASGMNFYCCIE